MNNNNLQRILKSYSSSHLPLKWCSSDCLCVIIVVSCSLDRSKVCLYLSHLYPVFTAKTFHPISFFNTSTISASAFGWRNIIRNIGTNNFSYHNWSCSGRLCMLQVLTLQQGVLDGITVVYKRKWRTRGNSVGNHLVVYRVNAFTGHE